MGEKILAGWKGIETYMADIGMPVRKAQLKKWERNAGFPIRRAIIQKRCTVYALPSDISTWLSSPDRLKGSQKNTI